MNFTSLYYFPLRIWKQCLSNNIWSVGHFIIISGPYPSSFTLHKLFYSEAYDYVHVLSQCPNHKTILSS